MLKLFNNSVMKKIDSVLDEVDEDTNEEIEHVVEETTDTEDIEEPAVIEEIEEQEVEHQESEPVTSAEEMPTSVEQSNELSENIETEFEKLVLEMEDARFSSERKALMEKQTSEFCNPEDRKDGKNSDW